MEEFILENVPSIMQCLVHYYKVSGMEKKTGKLFEDRLYKAEELFSYQEDGHICNWHLDTIEEYFGVPVYDYLLPRQDCYLNYGCVSQKSKESMRSYLKTPYLRNRAIKFHIDDFRRMIGVMV